MSRSARPASEEANEALDRKFVELALGLPLQGGHHLRPLADGDGKAGILGPGRGSWTPSEADDTQRLRQHNERMI